MNTWIIQGNPKYFRLDSYLKSHKTIKWGINPPYYGNKMMEKDIVYIWRSDGKIIGSGGIVAHGSITAPRPQMKDDTQEYWIMEPKDSALIKVVISLDEVRLKDENGMLKRSLLVNDSILADMKILKYPSQTAYLLEPKHAIRIYHLWSAYSKDLEE